MISKAFYLGDNICPNCGNKHFPTSELVTVNYIRKTCKCGYYNLSRKKLTNIVSIDGGIK